MSNPEEVSIHCELPQMKTRFAPSPTGDLHLGNVRTALFSALLAAAHQACFLLRIEDTDQTRSSQQSIARLQEDLAWLGLAWQEGPGQEGAHGPYLQSERQSIYDHFYQKLIDENWLYPCYCTEEELALTRKLQLAAGRPPQYPGTCRNLSLAKRPKDVPFTLRFRVPAHTSIEFVDLIRGLQHFSTEAIGDFIVRRADGSASFLFCNAIDDALMEVTHVLRGEDHLTNTPRQLLILRALNLLQPSYGHLPLITGSDGSPLSKRHGSYSVRELREQGYLPSAVINYLARLGHFYESNDLMNFNELAQQFSIGHIGRAPAHFDSAQLLYWQKQAIIKTNSESFWSWVGEQVYQQVPLSKHQAFFEAVAPNILFPQEGLSWVEALFSPRIDYSAQAKNILLEAGLDFFTSAIGIIEEQKIERLLPLLQKRMNIKGKSLFQPLRIALTGQIEGPEMVKLFELLGKEQMIHRLEQAKNFLLSQ